MHELIEQFGINWKLILAQIVNFGILFLVLKKFAYQPILNILEERRQKIARGLEMRDQAESELREAQAQKNEIIKSGSAEVTQILSSAKERAQNIENQATIQATEEAQKIINNAKKDMEKQKAEMIDYAYQESADVIKLALGKLLSETDLGSFNDRSIKETLDIIKKTSNEK